MTQQEMFDKALLGVVKQGALSKNEYGLCLYRTKEGYACAVGQLIDNKTAKLWDTLEDSGIKNIPLDWLPTHFVDNINFLGDMQKAHDNSETLQGFISAMQVLASRYTLNFPDSLDTET